jgi:hypothetical protein
MIMGVLRPVKNRAIGGIGPRPYRVPQQEEVGRA